MDMFFGAQKIEDTRWYEYGFMVLATTGTKRELVVLIPPNSRISTVLLLVVLLPPTITTGFETIEC